MQTVPALARFFAAALVASATGYGVARAVSSPPARAPGPAHFSLSQSRLASVPTSWYESEGSPLFTSCQWPDGKTSIRVGQTGTCHLLAPGEQFGLLESPMDGALYPKGSGPRTSDVRFAHLDSSTRIIDVGPVLMEYGDYSGGARPEVVRDGGSIWLFDDAAQSGSEALRISASTGAVLQRVVMPAISRPVLGANAEGLWLAQAGNSFYSQSTRLGIWLAPIGASRGVLLRPTSDFVMSMTAAGTSMDVVAVTRPFGPGQHAERIGFTP